MNYQDRAVVVTGGTGALGTAVVAALLASGAVCHVPYLDEQRIQHFAYRGDERVKLVSGCDLADEPGVARLFDGIDNLWASIRFASKGRSRSCAALARESWFRIQGLALAAASM